ncbi:HAD-IB family phosphatase [Luteolibacter flavescens]|uniref:HAD-IB family phosphatase n=1 Tax=Luteolibacter flavescens TaxID=1859460 RepID=A0ABT3FW44_9BACT|nr:HAD-IB family phosphatase [Luteolibacter flavescens]MCW1887802.1 HAD-IB family phosphatase [Luteolibacter flavescens]
MTDDMQAKLERGLGLFDLDGTLIAWDTQMLFADHVIRREGWRRAYLAFFAAFLPAAKILGDEGMKRVFLSYLWRADHAKIEAWARDFVAEFFPARCYAVMLEKLQRHRDAGHLTVLASASPEFYAREVGRVLGFDLALGTLVEWQGPMPLLPDLRNHKGAEKVRRLSEIIGAPAAADGLWPRSHGYSDSSADLPMLRCCVENTLVNPSERLTALGEEKGWHIERPAKPWSTSAGHAREVLRRIAGI